MRRRFSVPLRLKSTAGNVAAIASTIWRAVGSSGMAPPSTRLSLRTLGARFAGEAEHPLAHDVPLHLGGPTEDRSRTGEEEGAVHLTDRVLVHDWSVAQAYADGW